MKSIAYLLALVLFVDAGITESPEYYNWGVTQELGPTTTSADSSPTSIKPLATVGEAEYLQNTTSPLGVFRKGFAVYEKRIIMFIENMRRTCMNMYSDNMRFIVELEKYEDLLPKKAAEPCGDFTPNHTTIETSYTRFSELLTEPLKRLVRDLDFKLGHLKQAIVATDILNVLTLQMCAAQGENPCLPEATERMAKKLSYVKQLQRNLTLEMIKTQDQAEKVSENLNNLREQMFTQMTQAIKNYSCCLKGLSFNVTDNECNIIPAESTTVATSTVQTEVVKETEFRNNLRCLARGMFLCENMICVQANYRCDGDNDCGDGSDEENC